MRLWAGVLLVAFAASPLLVSAQPARWTTYSIPEAGISVDTKGQGSRMAMDSDSKRPTAKRA
jgi:hypothetical protein